MRRAPSAVRAIAGKVPRPRWHRRQPWHCGICNLHRESPSAGRLEPPDERNQVHAARRRDSGQHRPERRSRVAIRRGHRCRHFASVPPVRVRPVPPGGPDEHPDAWRPGPVDRETHRGSARRQRDGCKRGAGAGYVFSRAAAGREGIRWSAAEAFYCSVCRYLSPAARFSSWTMMRPRATSSPRFSNVPVRACTSRRPPPAPRTLSTRTRQTCSSWIWRHAAALACGAGPAVSRRAGRRRGRPRPAR